MSDKKEPQHPGYGGFGNKELPTPQMSTDQKEDPKEKDKN